MEIEFELLKYINVKYLRELIIVTPYIIAINII